LNLRTLGMKSKCDESSAGLMSYLFVVFVGFLGSLLGVTSVGLVAFAHVLSKEL
jgi:hypothetical protein